MDLLFSLIYWSCLLTERERRSVERMERESHPYWNERTCLPVVAFMCQNGRNCLRSQTMPKASLAKYTSYAEVEAGGKRQEMRGSHRQSWWRQKKRKRGNERCVKVNWRIGRFRNCAQPERLAHSMLSAYILILLWTFERSGNRCASLLPMLFIQVGVTLSTPQVTDRTATSSNVSRRSPS